MYIILIGKKPGYCGVAVFSKEKPISVKYGLNNSDFDNEGRMITTEFSGFFLVNICELQKCNITHYFLIILYNILFF